MNEKKFEVLLSLYKSKEPLYLREIVEKTKLPYGTVQSVLNRNKKLFDVKQRGKNKYFSLKNNLENNYLIQQLEIEKTKRFLEKNNQLRPFIEKCLELKIPILIFGSYVEATQTKNSDLDILIISDNKVKLPEHVISNKIHQIIVKPEKITEFTQEVLYEEIKDRHIIILGFDYFLNKVFICGSSKNV